jgi:hypothetical protein
MRPRGEVDGIRNLFVGAFKAYRNRAVHTVAGYSLDEARAIIHLVNLLLFILDQVGEIPDHPIRQDVADLLEPEAIMRLRAFLESLDDIGIRKGQGKSATPYHATMEYHRPSQDLPGPDEVTVFYLTTIKKKPMIAFRSASLGQVVGLDLDSLEEDLLQAGCVRVGVKTTPIRLYLDRYNDQGTFSRVYGILRDLMEKHRV